MRMLIVESVTFFKAEIEWKEFGHNKWLKLDFVEKHGKLSRADKNFIYWKNEEKKINHPAFFLSLLCSCHCARNPKTMWPWPSGSQSSGETDTHTHRVVRAACGASSRRGKSWLLQWAGEGRGCRQEWAKGPLLEGGNEGWRWLLLKYRGVSWIKEKEGQSFQREGTTKARAWRDASQYIAEWKDVCACYWIVRRQ